MLRRCAGLLLGTLALTGTAQATDQIRDRIQIDGQQATLLAEPLSGPLDDPATWTRFVAHARSAMGSCTANWRGYRADWRLDAQQLVLDRVVLGACADAPPTLPLEVLFPGQPRGAAAAPWSCRLARELDQRNAACATCRNGKSAPCALKLPCSES